MSPDRPGSRDSPAELGPYQIRERLGAGGMGVVYRAYDARLDRSVAIKQLRSPAVIDADQRERFRREARAAAKLTHPAIVQVHGVLELAGGDCIVMELVDGASIAALVDHGPLSPGQAALIARDVATGLAEAHRQGVIHRDLKGENVVVAAAGNAKILDFGLAKRLEKSGDEDTLTVAGTLVGTFRAMSPEQAAGRALDHRSDLFSLGTMLYEMTTGTSPFRGASNLETLKRVMSHQPPPAATVHPAVPQDLSDSIGRLLAKDPDQRFQSAEEVVAALDDFVGASGSHDRLRLRPGDLVRRGVVQHG